MSDNQVKIKKQTIDPTLTLEDVKKQLIDKGKKEGHLSHEEIAEKLQNFEMDSDQMTMTLHLLMKKIVLTRMIKSILMI